MTISKEILDITLILLPGIFSFLIAEALIPHKQAEFNRSIIYVITLSAISFLISLTFWKLYSYLSIKLKFAEMPSNSNWIKLYGVGILTGIGFTMSLFVGNLAFIEDTQHIDGVKIGVLCGSLLTAFVGYFLLLIVSNKK